IFDNSASMPYPLAPGTVPPISNMEYYIDSDPGFGNATSITVPGNSGDISNYAVNINLSGSLSIGTHYLYIRSKQNPWAITNVVPFSASGVVPVTWAFIKAQLINNKTLVNWATSQESNTSNFEIDHSIDGRTFFKVGELPAAGYSSTIKNYSFTHVQPITGFNYYRVKQIDKDGNFKYSVIVTVLKKEDLQQTIVAPNPVADMLNIVEPTQTFIESAEVFSTAGNLLMRKTINADVQVFSLPVHKLSGGMYIIRIHYKKKSRSYRFIKE
ncbi:MAG TPA: T9SS type A sorting domain-containing protein, partial [Ferruginibacter sp.]|nr:T9SS type A sorting domain-containing protein [Ferruginibacter sp.]